MHLTVPVTRRLRSELVVVHRTSDLLPVDLGERGPLQLTSPVRTAVDLAGLVDVSVLEVAIESALNRRLFSPGQLRWRAQLRGGKGSGGSRALQQLVQQHALGGAESSREVRTAQVLVAAGLPAPVRQHRVMADGRAVARVDLAYPDERIAIEYDSDAWHHGVARRHGDAARRDALRVLGWAVVEVTPALLRDAVALVAVVAGVRAAQAEGRYSRKWRRSRSS